ncbi:FAD-dependent monooxygenase [Rhodopseudomonas sp. RCAM05734]|uniref:FAD-dependent monooxygenase n=1 Tax=Rhodopseudomonas sp. RCAM05734 TaxID=3457549 RepID=UPI004043E10C
MQNTDVAIIGGGLAGSIAAAMLGRAGIKAVLVDPFPSYPPDFRCEKLGSSQIALLSKTGLAEHTLPAATLDGEVWEARFGHVVARKPSDQHGIMYDTLVNTIRTAIPADIPVVHARVTGIATSADRQKITLSDGDEISARLVVLANGLSVALRDMLGLERPVISPCHSITIGFDVAPVGREAFDFPALTYWPKRSSDRLAYMTLFPIGSAMRANVPVYRQMDDPWLREFRRAPEATMRALMPNLQGMMGDFAVVGPVKIRPADLYVTQGHRQAGVVLVGDAFATSCPAAGTGTDKVFTDVAQLCTVYIPNWLATGGMGAEKIAAFYDDPIKTSCDARSLAKAHHLRSLTLSNSLAWRAQRWARFVVRLGLGTLLAIRKRLGVRSASQRSAVPPQPHFDAATR